MRTLIALHLTTVALFMPAASAPSSVTHSRYGPQRCGGAERVGMVRRARVGTSGRASA
jgi:hypothetical protein